MKALVATAETQGTQRGDGTECIEGELVWMIDPCPNSVRNPLGFCPCGRSFKGMNSHGETTTAKVRDISWLTPGSYAAALRSCFDAMGWCVCCRRRPVSRVIEELIALADALPVGAVVGRRLDELVLRTPPDTRPAEAA
ncbi:hypothetical protein EEJ31_08700 [Cryobacterium tepidiphilum]|uniref:DUF7715 domain-containing protein n=2 Tax=Cryobacterium tepidiphilum TaxID=2486026 RepID=A0A3M8L9W5_9MICO|nr:hypothetical protein EEJ31_08700 [Cryobacterium tepidiphilum]